MTQIETLEALTGDNHQPEGSLVKRTPLMGTPFWIIETKEGFNLTMGRWKLNPEPMQTEDELLTWMETDKWNILCSMTICIATDVNNQQSQAKPN